MQRNVMEYLEQIVDKDPDKTAYANGEMGYSFRQVYDYSRAIGTYLGKKEFRQGTDCSFHGKAPQRDCHFLWCHLFR